VVAAEVEVADESVEEGSAVVAAEAIRGPP